MFVFHLLRLLIWLSALQLASALASPNDRERNQFHFTVLDTNGDNQLDQAELSQLIDLKAELISILVRRFTVLRAM